MQQSSSDRVETRAVGDVGTGVSEHRDDAVGDGAPLARQVVAEAVCRLHKRRQHDRLVGELHCAKYLK